MITIVVVGRNDNHGYNLSKRVSTSLNSMARMLSPGDEIIFVDWNTPTGYPVMAVSIQDDLLPKTKSLLRIVRVPERIHKLASGGSSRALIEPIARNVGIRRASKSSKWILSTNTDIIFASPSGRNFREIIADLEETLWLSYRFELPEFLWDRLDKRNPDATSDFILKCYQERDMLTRIRVDEEIGADFPIPDGVGDFQLATTELWKTTSGFPEGMTKGWHVDTRLTLQMGRVSPRPPKLLQESDLIIFHQNHLRNSTSYHDSSEVNSQETINAPYKNLDTWGLNDYLLDEECLLVQNGLKQNSDVNVSQISWVPDDSFSSLEELSKRLDYNLGKVMLFLRDEISILPKGSLIHCYTKNPRTKLALEEILTAYQMKIEFQDLEYVLVKGTPTNQDLVQLLILDFGVESSTAVYSPIFGGQSDSNIKAIGLIPLNTEKIANLYTNPYMRVSIIRAQNWASREMARTFFDLPLFNNYTSLLCGQKKRNAKIRFLRRWLLASGIISEYSLDTDTGFTGLRLGSLKVGIGFRSITSLSRAFKLLPSYIQIPIRRFIKKCINL